ncbi:MAG: 50S ribosomal protein L22 [Candidatus Moranbacteria bacterium]|nr:50S ribosomal protein L22 [Candidatus Moranbacteria bacterium]
MKVYATLNNLRIAPRKVRLVTHMLVGVDAREALAQLDRQAKRSSKPIQTLLKSALANATNNFGLDESNLYIFEVCVGDGLRLKRWLPKAFGRATPLLRRGSNVTVVLEEKVEGKNRILKKDIAAEETVKEGEVISKEKEEKKSHVLKSETKTLSGKDISKKTANKTAIKKVFQRKSV